MKLRRPTDAEKQDVVFLAACAVFGALTAMAGALIDRRGHRCCGSSTG